MRQRKIVRRASTDLQTLKRRAFLNRRGAAIETLEARRLLSAGDLDTTFSGDGKLMTDLGNRTVAAATAVQSDGKILVAGTANGDAVLIRYNTNGTLDTSFDGDGGARLSWSGTESFSDLEILPDGKILVGGNYNSTNWWLARYRTNGTLDAGSGFGGTDGIQTGTGRIAELELQGTKIITGGGDVVRRHNANGSIDTTFGSGGSVSIVASTAVNRFAMVDMEVGPNGRIVASGQVNETGEDGEFAAGVAVRLTSGGAVDNSFDDNGLLYMGGSRSVVGPVAIGTDNRVFVSQHDEGILTVSKRNDDGSSVWGTSFSWGTTEGGAILKLGLDSSGRLVAVGSASTDAATFEADAVLARFNAGGGLDLSFGDGGFAYVGFDESALRNDAATGVAFAPGGNIVIAGVSQNWVDAMQSGDDVNLIVARFQAASAPPSQPVYIQDRVLHVDGTAGNDTIKTVGGFGGSEVVDVTLNGVTYQFSEEDFDSILIRSFAGNDSFDDGSPYATLFEGGDGNDSVLTFNDEGGVFATVVGGAGDDVVEFDAAPVAELSPFDGGTGRDKIIIGPNFGFDLDLRDFPTVEDGQIRSFGTLTGNSLNNHLTIDEFGTIHAGDGNDTLGGGAFPDFVELYGENGNDVLNGTSVAREPGDPPNILDGGAGNDTLRPGTGNERLIGGAGTDELTYASRTTALNITLGAGVNNDGTAGEGDDAAVDIERVRGGSGNDSITGTSAGNTFFGNAGNDTLFGMGGNDALFGGSANDRIRGGSGNDYIEGNSGNDTLYGDAGLDRILGHDGNDYFWVRDGERDTLDGGVGNYDRAQVDSFDVATNMEAFIP